MKVKRTLIVLSIVLAGACTEEKFNYHDGTDIAMFSETSRQFLVTDAVGDNVMDVAVCSPVKWETDRSYVVKLMKGPDKETNAIEHMNFEIASSLVVVIPAGEYVGYFQLRAFQNSLYPDKDKYVYFELTPLDEEHPVADFNNSMTVALTQVCSMPLSALVGKYTLTSEIGDSEGQDIRITTDPEHEDGLLVLGAYSGDALPLRLWLNAEGRYSVVTRESCYLGPVLTDTEGTTYDCAGEATGEFNPCSGTLTLDFFIHPIDSPNSGLGATEVFERAN